MNLDSMAVEYIDPLFSITLLHFPYCTSNFQARKQVRLQKIHALMLRKDWGLIISRRFWLPMATGQLTQWICKIAYEINSYECLWALCNSIDNCKLQHWTDYLFVFLLIPNTEVIKQGKVSPGNFASFFRARVFHIIICVCQNIHCSGSIILS